MSTPHPKKTKTKKKVKCHEKVENHKLAVPLLSGTQDPEIPYHTLYFLQAQ
jgi:hypothetical protein